MALAQETRSLATHWRCLALLLVVWPLAGRTARADDKTGPSGRDPAAKALREYKEASRAFQASAPTEESVAEFYRPWRERLVAAAAASKDPDNRIAALERAIAISNRLRDYAYSVALIQMLLNLNLSEEVKSYWLMQLGETAERELVTHRNKDYGKLAVATYRRLLEGASAITVDDRLLVTGWLATIAGLMDTERGIVTKNDVAAAAKHVEDAVEIFKRGHQPGGRLVGTGFDQRWFLEYAIRLHVLLGAYNRAFAEIREYAGIKGPIPLSAAGIIVSSERMRYYSDPSAFANDTQLEAHVRFLDRCAAHLEDDPYGVTLRLVAAQRYFQHGDYEAATPRLEALLTTYRGAIQASKYSDYYLADILRMLRDIYFKRKQIAKAVQAAEEAIPIKRRVNLPTEVDENLVRQYKSK